MVRSKIHLRGRAGGIGVDRRDRCRQVRRAAESRPRACALQHSGSGGTSASVRLVLLRKRQSSGVCSVSPEDLRGVEWFDDVELVARSRVARGVLPALAIDCDGRGVRRSGSARRNGAITEQPVREGELHVEVRPRRLVLHDPRRGLAAR